MTYPFAKNHPLQSLLLDHENPRLPVDLDRNDDAILEYLTRNAAVEDLVQSIGENGFFFAEALVAVPKEAGLASEQVDDDTPLIVVEGNRRLTALKILNNPDLASRSVFAKIAASAQHHPTDIPTIVYESRDAVLQFLGYRHITGVKPWDSLAKARYIEQLYGRTSAQASRIDRYREVAQMVGSKPQYIRRSLNAIAALNVAIDEDFFGLNISEEDVDFSVLLTALGYSEIQRFVLTNPDDLDNTHIFEQTQSVNKKTLSDLFSWMFVKGRSDSTRLVESRNLKKLAAIIATDKALERFYSGATIDQAYVSSKGSEVEFSAYLQDANSNLDEAAQLVAFVDYSEVMEETSKRILVQAQHINKSMAGKRD